MGMMRTLTINGTKYDVVPVVPAASITLLAEAWVSSGDVHSQVVEIPDVTPHTKVDLQPTAEQLEEFHYKVLAFVAENNYGVVTVYSIGDMPTDNHTIQITKTEVEGVSPIRGNTVGTTMPRPDWNQEDPTKADYIKNKEAVNGHLTNTSNPHNVTATQVGARPDTWMPAAEEVGARPNTWLPTIAEIGAAPAGYGYGENLSYVNTQDSDGSLLESYLDSHFVTQANAGKVFRFSDLASYPDCAVSIMGGFADLHIANGLYCELVGYFYTASCGVSVARKLKYNGTWLPWEYDNPPMVSGDEYRTTERYYGKPVYTRLLNTGALTNGASVSIVEGGARIVRCVATNGRYTSPFHTPSGLGSEWSFWHDVYNSEFVAYMGSGQPSIEFDVQVWYTKD